MAVKKPNIISIVLLLALAITPVSNTFADDENNLVQVDLKRASDNSVNVTFFTSTGYNDNVLVRKKSDNKYVILIPKVQSNGFSIPSLYGVKDLVTNIDVKTVNDTSGGYTKVTLITTKPLDIKTSTQKSLPVTEEQKEYKTLIAQANAIKNNIGKQEAPSQKTEVTVNKAADVKPASNEKSAANQTVKKDTPKVTKTETKQETKKEIKSQTKQTTEPKIELTEINPQNNDRQKRKQHLAELIQEVKQEKSAEQIPETTILQEINTAGETIFNGSIKDINEMPGNNRSILPKIKNTARKTAKAAGFALLSVLCLIMTTKLVKTLVSKSKELKVSSGANPAKQPEIENNVKYNNITNNQELSWQEKYRRYLDESAKPVPRANNKGTYTFIKTPDIKIEEKRKELEKMVSEVSSVNTNIPEPEIIKVNSEDNVIQKTIKFKAFDNHKTSLDMTNRDKLKSRFKKYENEIPLHEQKNIELGNSILHANPRRLKDANLDVSDVKKGGIMKFKPSNYIMSSVDEYFSILDNEEKTVIAESIKNPAPVNIPKKPVTMQRQTNPISKLRNETKSSYVNGLIIKSGFNIDNNKGFYIVNFEGKSALIGKVNEEVFVLKKFDSNVTNPIQVRHDNNNVYMVKAGGFKSLVEVEDNKMGVLIEL